jgi:hypothetical protein
MKNTQNTLFSHFDLRNGINEWEARVSSVQTTNKQEAFLFNLDDSESSQIKYLK